MRYKITKNYYAPMCPRLHGDDAKASHGIIVRGCNFKCRFCNIGLQDDDSYCRFSDDEFALAIAKLMPEGCRFKFSGGEPTVDKSLKDKVSFVKQCGGYVFLDTNGSNPSVVERMLGQGLIDVLGISLKGITREQAIKVANPIKAEFCWENPLRLIGMAHLFPKSTFIVTHVFFDEADFTELESFSKLIPSTPNVCLKMNNLLFDKHHEEGLKRIDELNFMEMAEEFLRHKPQWRGRLILVNGQDAIANYDSITFM